MITWDSFGESMPEELKNPEKRKFKVGDKVRVKSKSVFKSYEESNRYCNFAENPGYIRRVEGDPYNSFTNEAYFIVSGFREGAGEYFFLPCDLEFWDEEAENSAAKNAKEVVEEISGGKVTIGAPDERLIILEQPKWAQELISKNKADISHMFVLWGDIRDYVWTGKEGEYISFYSYLLRLAEQREFVVSYNISAGIKVIKGDAKKFNDLAGIKKDEETKGKDILEKYSASSGTNQASPNLALARVEKFLVKLRDQKALVIIEYTEDLAPEPVGSLSESDKFNKTTFLRWADSDQINQNGHLILLLTANLYDLHPALRTGDCNIKNLFVKKPDRGTRKDYIAKHLLPQYKDIKVKMPPDELAHLTAGLSLIQIEEMFAEQESEGEEFSSFDIQKRKEEIIKQEYGGLLEIMEPKHGWGAVGGLGHVKNYFNGVIKAMKTGDLKRVPMGVLFTGPPGTGKTVTAEAVAKEAGFNFIKFNPGNLFNQFVGNSEAYMRKAIACVEAFTPVVLFIDEFDRAFGQRDEASTDSGVTRRQFGSMLEFMSNTGHRGRVFIIGATNRPDLIDPAMKRPGRFDDKILFPYPAKKERERIFPAILTKWDYESGVKDFSRFAEATKGFSGGHIEDVVRRAYVKASDNGNQKISEKDIDWAIGDVIIETDLDEIRRYMRFGMRECNSKSLLPPDLDEILEELGMGEKDEVFVGPPATLTERRARVKN